MDLCNICFDGFATGEIELSGKVCPSCEKCANKFEIYNRLPEGDVGISVIDLNGSPLFSMEVDFLTVGDFDSLGDDSVTFKTTTNYDVNKIRFTISWENLSKMKDSGEIFPEEWLIPLDNGAYLKISRTKFKG